MPYCTILNIQKSILKNMYSLIYKLGVSKLFEHTYDSFVKMSCVKRRIGQEK